jgi:hypothetical protein
MFSSGEEQGGNAPQMGLFIYYNFPYAIIYIYMYIHTHIYIYERGFWKKKGKQKMDCLYGEIRLKLMIWRYHHL